MIATSSRLRQALQATDLQRQAIIAFASIGDFISVADDGTLDASNHAVALERLAALERFDIDDRPVSARKGGGRIRRLRIRLACKVTALNALSKHLGLFGAAPPPWPEPDVLPPFATGGHRRPPNFLLNAEHVRDEYSRIAFANMGDFIESDPDGSWRLVLPHAEPEKLATLRELAVDQHIDRPAGAAPVIRSMNLKLADKLRALEALTRLPLWLRVPEPATRHMVVPAKGLRIVSPPMTRPSCRSSLQSVSQPASIAAARIRES